MSYINKADTSELKNYYFTFGSDPAYPYGINDYVLITAPNIYEAQEVFKSVHPNRPGSDCLNYAFNYSEAEWTANDMCNTYYDGKNPVEIISSVSGLIVEQGKDDYELD